MGLRVAKAWGMTPRQWRETDVDDRALMMAYELFEITLESYRNQHAREHYEKKAGQKTSGVNEFSQMKSNLGIR